MNPQIKNPRIMKEKKEKEEEEEEEEGHSIYEVISRHTHTDHASRITLMMYAANSPTFRILRLTPRFATRSSRGKECCRRGLPPQTPHMGREFLVGGRGIDSFMSWPERLT
jgi:hypothetical protein